MKRSQIVIVLFTLILAQAVWGQVPSTINYQGVLKVDDELADGDYTLRFKLCDVVGTALGTPPWFEDHTLTVVDGIFSVILGQSVAFSSPGIYFTEPYWLEISIVDGQTVTTLSPRVELAAAPYAIKARGVATNVSSFHGGVLGVGTASPVNNLEVVGTWSLGSVGEPPGGFDSWLGAENAILYEAGGAGYAHHFSAYGGGDIVRFGQSPGSGQAPDSRVVITNDGWLGIGTTTPSTHLHVNGSILVDDSYALKSSNEQIVNVLKTGSDDYTWLLPVREGYGTKFMNWNEDAALMTILDNGNVGIGTADPTANLEVVGDVKADTVIANMLTIPATTRYYSIPAAEFLPYDWDVVSVPYIADEMMGMMPFNISAPVHLPHGAIITEFSARVYDGHTIENITVSLLYANAFADAYTNITTMTSSYDGGNLTLENGLPPHTVDNINNVYVVTASWTSPVMPDQADIKFRNALIGYTVNQPLP
ncbi:hypothetical protein ACFL4K_03485 [Candidatus Neomarinimicrobiota bacterium]